MSSIPTPNSRHAHLPGFTVPEVLVSLFVLTLGMLAATVLVITLLHGTSASRETVVMTNLAREGIEAVRNRRDSNWQANSGSQRDAAGARDHWNDEFKDAFVAGITPSAPKLYVAAEDTTAGLITWHLLPPDPTDASGRYAAGCDATVVSTLTSVIMRTQLYRDPASGRLISPCAAGSADPANRTRYRREIHLSCADNGVVPLCPNAKELWVESVVEEYSDTNPAAWTGPPKSSVRLETTLSDWFGRKDKG